MRVALALLLTLPCAGTALATSYPPPCQDPRGDTAFAALPGGDAVDILSGDVVTNGRQATVLVRVAGLPDGAMARYDAVVGTTRGEVSAWVTTGPAGASSNVKFGLDVRRREVRMVLGRWPGGRLRSLRLDTAYGWPAAVPADRLDC